MLGDFGEVYLLDWGLAKLQGSPELAAAAGPDVASSASAQRPRRDDGNAGVHGARAGARARPSTRARTCTRSARCSSSSWRSSPCIHRAPARRRSPRRSSAPTRVRASGRPALDLPPELDAICVRATALDPRDRFASAKEVVDAIERFLDGDRDLQIRRERAADHARLAAEQAERAFASGPGATEARGRALRDAGRAIALDPSNSDAIGTLIRLLTDPPREVPPEALAEVHRERLQNLTTGDRIASRGFMSWFVLAPLGFVMGIGSWPAALLSTGAWMVAAAVPYFASRSVRRHAKANMPMLLSGAFAIASTSALFGPYFFLPGFAIIFGMLFVLVPPDSSRRFLVVVLSLLTILLPALLAWIGVIPQPYEIGSDRIVIHAVMLHFSPVSTQIFLLVSSLAGRAHGVPDERAVLRCPRPGAGAPVHPVLAAPPDAPARRPRGRHGGARPAGLAGYGRSRRLGPDAITRPEAGTCSLIWGGLRDSETAYGAAISGRTPGRLLGHRPPQIKEQVPASGRSSWRFGCPAAGRSWSHPGAWSPLRAWTPRSGRSPPGPLTAQTRLHRAQRALRGIIQTRLQRAQCALRVMQTRLHRAQCALHRGADARRRGDPRVETLPARHDAASKPGPIVMKSARRRAPVS